MVKGPGSIHQFNELRKNHRLNYYPKTARLQVVIFSLWRKPSVTRSYFPLSSPFLRCLRALRSLSLPLLRVFSQRLLSKRYGSTENKGLATASFTSVIDQAVTGLVSPSALK